MIDLVQQLVQNKIEFIKLTDLSNTYFIEKPINLKDFNLIELWIRRNDIFGPDPECKPHLCKQKKTKKKRNISIYCVFVKKLYLICYGKYVRKIILVCNTQMYYEYVEK